MSATEVLAAIVSVLATALVALLIVVGHIRERVVKLEEWARLAEKRWNGQG